MDVGLALWTMQSTAAAPGNPAALHARFVADARAVEAMGYHSLWLGEHRFWYDGWTPAPLVAAAAGVAATTTLRFGTAMLLLPQHDPERVVRTVVALDRLSDGRVDVGLGLGHRDAEFDGLGLERRHRGARMDRALDHLLDAWHGTTVQRPHPPVWIGGMADAAIRRGARRGLSFLLPQSLSPDVISRLVETVRTEAGRAGVAPGRIGVLRDAFVAADGAAARASLLPRLRSHYREEAGSWWILKGTDHGFGLPGELDRQLRRVTDNALVGTPDEVGEALDDLAGRGVDLVALRFHFDVTRDQALESAALLAAALPVPAVHR